LFPSPQRPPPAYTRFPYTTLFRSQGGGGWANGDAMYVGPNPPSDAVITYYQRRRHIFGDMKLEVFDASGKRVGTMPTSKRRGLRDRKSTRLNSSHVSISYAVFCLK